MENNINIENNNLYNDLGTLSFKQDNSGNWGYCIGGADSVTPFKTRTGNATVDNVLSGKTFSNTNSSGLTGNMPDNSGTTKSATGTLDGTNQILQLTIPSNGYYNTSAKLYATYST